ncbi:MAG: SDR family NAD(P)-dependent oxidoreductase [Sphingobium sp.]
MTKGLGLEGKSVVVTGGASNIGRAVALALADEGAAVTIMDIDRAQGERTVAAAAGLPGAMRLVPCDFGVPAEIEAAFEAVGRAYGAIDTLVNNVGWSRPAWFRDVSLAEMDKAIALNLMSTIHATRAALPHMVERGGSIVSVASDAAFGELKSAVYGAAKGGIISFMKNMALEYGRHGIRCNVVAPGLVLPPGPDDVGAGSLWAIGGSTVIDDKGRADILKTIPLRRLTTPDDVAGAILFLASDRLSAQVTGQVFSVSGGRQMP